MYTAGKAVRKKSAPCVVAAASVLVCLIEISLQQHVEWRLKTGTGHSIQGHKIVFTATTLRVGPRMSFFFFCVSDDADDSNAFDDDSEDGVDYDATADRLSSKKRPKASSAKNAGPAVGVSGDIAAPDLVEDLAPWSDDDWA